MTRDDERRVRAAEAPIVGGLPDAPGIVAAMRLSPGLEEHLRGLADELLVHPFPGATLSRAERELLATAVSAANDCFYCMDSHGSFASELLRRAADPAPSGGAVGAVVDAVKTGGAEGLGPRLAALVHVARVVARRARDLERVDVEHATAAGATDGDVQLAVLIAAAFAMYSRMVDGLRAKTPAEVAVFADRARQIADHGYRTPPGPTQGAK
jgi:uncharacterized peroxidase-related enzyme